VCAFFKHFAMLGKAMWFVTVCTLAFAVVPALSSRQPPSAYSKGEVSEHLEEPIQPSASYRINSLIHCTPKEIADLWKTAKTKMNKPQKETNRRALNADELTAEDIVDEINKAEGKLSSPHPDINPYTAFYFRITSSNTELKLEAWHPTRAMRAQKDEAVMIREILMRGSADEGTPKEIADLWKAKKANLNFASFFFGRTEVKKYERG